MLSLFIFCASINGCGGSEKNTSDDSGFFQVSGTGSVVYLKALSPLFLAFAKSCPDQPDPTKCNTLVPVQSQFNLSTLNGYDAVIEPDLSPDRTVVNSVITGIGIEAQNYQTGGAYPIHLGVVGRQFDFSSGKFLNNYRIFSAPGENFDGAQDFSIQNAISDNIFIAGLGLQLHGGKVTKLELQRKTLAKLGSSGSALTASTRVTLDNGWAAVGFLIRFQPNAITDPLPYLQEVLLYTGQLTTQ